MLRKHHHARHVNTHHILLQEIELCPRHINVIVAVLMQVIDKAKPLTHVLFILWNGPIDYGLGLSEIRSQAKHPTEEISSAPKMIWDTSAYN